MSAKFSNFSRLINEAKISPYLPETALFNKNTFYEFLNKYFQVIIRPSQDIKLNIIVTTLTDPQYQIELGLINQIVTGQQEAYQFIEKNLLDGKKFIIQQSIPRAKHNEKHFDIRVYAAKRSTKWTITEKIARITPNGFSITDEVKDIFPAHEILLKEYQENSSDIRMQLDHIALLTAEILEETYSKYNLVMIDFYFDQLGKPWIHDIRYRFTDGKWDWHQVLRGEKDLFPYLPESYPFHEKVLHQYLEKYKSCIIKPNRSQWGRGLALISQTDNQTYEIHSERKKLAINHFNELLNEVHDRFVSKKSYLIQEKILLPTIKGCPFDIRVMVQRKSVDSEWEVTGRITRTAATGFIVTNVAKALLSLEDAIEASNLTPKNTESLIWEMDHLCKLAAIQLEKVYPDARIWGMDIGIDQFGKPWFIEANLVPDISIFRFLSDRTMYNKIREYIRETDAPHA
ncbi:YheC/YheD family protein, partial [Neobacillus niacini]|uniref:YheC/YheD family protein n=1 Tax=Neobacillus niacini TaxID=86668 RepID=UPI0030033E1E